MASTSQSAAHFSSSVHTSSCLRTDKSILTVGTPFGWQALTADAKLETFRIRRLVTQLHCNLHNKPRIWGSLLLPVFGKLLKSFQIKPEQKTEPALARAVGGCSDALAESIKRGRSAQQSAAVQLHSLDGAVMALPTSWPPATSQVQEVIDTSRACRRRIACRSSSCLAP